MTEKEIIIKMGTPVMPDIFGNTILEFGEALLLSKPEGMLAVVSPEDFVEYVGVAEKKEKAYLLQFATNQQLIAVLNEKEIDAGTKFDVSYRLNTLLKRMSEQEFGDYVKALSEMPEKDRKIIREIARGQFYLTNLNSACLTHKFVTE